LQRHKPLRVCVGCGGEAKFNYKAGIFGTDISEPTSPACKNGTKCEAFTFYCSTCFHITGPFLDLQAAITMWHRVNKPNCENSLQLWHETHQQQINTNKD
jgi:hypothetical protein